MKATLEFNLPEENEEFELAKNAVKYSIVLDEVDERLFRQPLKYDNVPPALKKAIAENYLDMRVVCRVLEALREDFHNLKEENDI